MRGLDAEGRTGQGGSGCRVSGVSGDNLKQGLEASALGLGILRQDRFIVHAGGVQAVVSLGEHAGGKCLSGSLLCH